MNSEILFIIEQIKETYEGDPWFGRNAKALITEVNEQAVFEKPNGQHSILELVWHMITWREFTINRLRNDKENDLHYFEVNDWRNLDHADKSLWQQALHRLHQTQNELIEVLQTQRDNNLLSQRVEGREYDFRKLLNGVFQHDIYHLGQIAYIKKLLESS